MHRKFVHVFYPLIMLTWCMAIGEPAFAQTPDGDTLRLTLPQAKERFLKNNLSLLIQRYQVDQAKAAIITARLFDNPQFSIDNVLYNPQTKKFFDMSYNGGEYSAQLSQLFQTAGKRNKNIQLAQISAQQEQYQFYDLLRTLSFTLNTDFYKIYFLEQSEKVYQEEINSLATTLKAFKEQYDKGNIALKEVLRIQSQLYSLQSEQNDLRDQIQDAQTEFKLLIRASVGTYVSPQNDFDATEKSIVGQVNYQRLLDSALTNRADLKNARSGVDYSNVNLSLQKAMAVPDVTVQLGYDKQGSYIRDYNSAGLAFSLPFFNRNQGAIKQARIAVDASKAQLQSQQDQVESDVATAYKSALRLENLYNSFDPKFKYDFNHLIVEVAKNYQKHNISLLEFLDFYDSYKTNTLQFNNLQLNRVSSLMQLNYATGTTFFNY